MRKKLLGYYDYTVILTYCGMLSGFLGILQAIGGNYWTAAFCLMAAGICDMFDGAVAATKMRDAKEKSFGIQIDSLSDLVSFGILPGIFVYLISGRGIFAGVAASFFALCALIRLAYFNVLEEERQKQTVEKRKRSICFPVLLVLVGTGFLLPVKIKKPGVAGKIGILILGIFEVLGMFLFMGWDAV